MKKTLLFASALSFAMTMNAQLKVTNLRVEHMSNPTVVDETEPRFSWINEAIGVNEPPIRLVWHRLWRRLGSRSSMCGTRRSNPLPCPF